MVHTGTRNRIQPVFEDISMTGALRIGNRVVGGKHPKIAVPVWGPQAFHSAEKAAAAGADLVEIRADMWPASHIDSIGDIMNRIRGKLKMPLILTVRGDAQSGPGQDSGISDDNERIRMYEALIEYASAVDVEVASRRVFDKVISMTAGSKVKIIASHHDFTHVPPDNRLKKLASRSADAGAHFFKVACHARSGGELADLFSFCARCHDIRVIAMAMGPLGPASRLAAPAFGSALGYAYWGRANVPGQVDVRTLKLAYTSYY